MIPLSIQTYGAEEIEAIGRVLESGRVTMGDEVRAFEQEFAAYIGTRHAIMCNSGSSANLLMVAALRAMGRVREGDVVFAPALTWSTTVWPLIRYGLKVVLVDCDRHLQMCPEHLAALAGKYERGRAVFAAHIMGNPFNVPAIQAVCNKHNLILLEDSCETLGADYLGIKTGRFGDMASFSFYFSHHMTTIEGGMVVTDDGVLDAYLRGLRSHGWSRAFDSAFQEAAAKHSPEIDPRFLFVCEGYNLRPTEIQGAMGRVQLRKLPEMNWKREIARERMIEAVEPMRFLEPIRPTPNGTPNWFAFPALIKGADRSEVARTLDVRGIQTRPIVAGNLARHPGFKGRVLFDDLPNADTAMRHGLYWGLHPQVSAEDVQGLRAALEACELKGAA